MRRHSQPILASSWFISNSRSLLLLLSWTDSCFWNSVDLRHSCRTKLFGSCFSSTTTTRTTTRRISSEKKSTMTGLTTSSLSATVWNDGAMKRTIEQCVVPLGDTSYKGSSGRVGVLGGSAKYTGAPYYAAMAALQAGADLAYVLTAHEAAVPIKCYSPELMVAPVYSAAAFDAVVQRDPTLRSTAAEQLIQLMVAEVETNIERLHCLIIGPGMGRCPMVMRAVARIILLAREKDLHLVLDADALFMLSLDEQYEHYEQSNPNNPNKLYKNLLRGYKRAIITPNQIEHKRLFPSHPSEPSKPSEPIDESPFQDVTIVRKGKHDQIVCNHRIMYTCEELGGMKRSGGIGDILAGTIGTLSAWNAILSASSDRNCTTNSTNSTNSNEESLTYHTTTATESDSTNLHLSVWMACCIVKRSTHQAFSVKKRAMTAPDVLQQLGPCIEQMLQ